MTSIQMVNAQENYLDNIEEFPVWIITAVASENGIVQQAEEEKPCDETIGYLHIVDEYENVDRFKHLPRASDGHNVNKSKVNMPSFQVKINPFKQGTDYSTPNSNGNAASSLILINGIAQSANGSKKQIENGCYPQGSINNYASIKSDIVFEQNGNNVLRGQEGIEVEGSFEDSMNDANMDTEIINQIAVQIPELLEKSDMREAILTPSLVDGLKAQGNQQPEKKSAYSKKITEAMQADEEENMLLPKIDARSQQLESEGNDEEKEELARMQQAQRLKEEQDEGKLMEGYESDGPAPVEDEKVIHTLVFRDSQQFHKKNISRELMAEILRDFKYIQVHDECRTECSYKEGGKECKDKRIKEQLRTIAKDILKEVGRKILSGSFNLTQISFPIRAMLPKTGLEKALYSTSLFPLYITKAAHTNDLVERFKLLICATIGNFYVNLGFVKPLNPILGETCAGIYPDGTRLYAEQISHHPPISYFTVYGPDKSYFVWGNYNYESNASLNSLKLKNNGSRHIKFKDGQLISYNFAKEVFSGSFMGVMRVESKGVITFKDEKNNITAEIVFDSVKKRPSDFLSGKITVNNTVVSNCYGSFMGFIEFDNVRYWDYRYILPYQPIILKGQIPSDQSHRLDKQYLGKCDIVNAQKYKEELEELQRTDARLRTKYAQAKAKKK